MQIPNLYYIPFTVIYIIYINHQNINNLNNTHDSYTSSTDNIIKFKSEKNISLIYNQKGKLTCKLITKHIQYFDNIKTIYFIQPTAILFNKNNIPIWNITAKKGKMTHNKIMYLYENVQIINLIKNTYLQSITTNTAVLNLVTHDIYSNEKTTIHGISFQTITLNLHSNLDTKITELSKKVHTIYEKKDSKKPYQ